MNDSTTPDPAERGDTTDEALDAIQQEALDTEADDHDADPPGDLDALQTALHNAQQRALRSQAELENFRKRTRREMEDERRYAGVPLIREMLNVVDNLQRAVQAAEQDENASGLLEGVRLCAEQMVTILGQHQCRPIEAVGQVFDPNLHEAIGQVPSNEHAAGTVVIETRTGYQLHERVVRPSQVMIAAPAANDAATGPSAAADDNDARAAAESDSDS